MKVLNIHERELHAAPEKVGALIDALASPTDALWPRHSWPRLEFDRPLNIGANGGHGPVRYFVESYTHGQAIKFRFTGPKGFDGYHGYEIVSSSDDSCVLRHTLEMTAHGSALLSWPLAFRPMHDALIEDSFATAQAALGLTPTVHMWSLGVRFLRWIISGGRARSQVTPNPSFQRTASGAR